MDIEGSVYAAEVALVYGENSLRNLDEYKKLDGINTTGHFDPGDQRLEDYTLPTNSSIDWKNKSLKISTSQMPAAWQGTMSSNPHYIIKHKKFVSDCNTIGINTCENTGIDVLNVVAVGKGRSDKTSTTLETTVGVTGRPREAGG